jgi:catechol 2,3-dioxygenase-like lactoylglutathione lyase family enzyme
MLTYKVLCLACRNKEVFSACFVPKNPLHIHHRFKIKFDDREYMLKEDTMTVEHVTPLLLCPTLDDTLRFYQALGFEVTYRQDEPYFYGAVQLGGIDLNFAKGKGGFSCLVHVPRIDTYYTPFANGLRTEYGKIPTANFPRITRLWQGQTRFHLFDPAGNSLTFINVDEPDIDYEAFSHGVTPMQKSLDNATFLRDTYADDVSAAKVLDRALAKHPNASPLERARALGMRAELAVALDDVDLSRTLRAELQEISLSEEDRANYHDVLTAADRLEQWRVSAQEND